MVYDFFKDYEELLSYEQASLLDYRLDNIAMKLNEFFQRLIIENIKSSISSVLFQIGGDRYHDLIIIALSWKTVVGSYMAEHSSVLKYQNNTP